MGKPIYLLVSFSEHLVCEQSTVNGGVVMGCPKYPIVEVPPIQSGGTMAVRLRVLGS